MPQRIDIGRKLIIHFFLTLLLCTSYGITTAQVNKKVSRPQRQKDGWSLYPFALELSYHPGASLPPVIMIDVYPQDKLSKIAILSWGVRFDMSLLYARKWVWENFDCFPKLGLLAKYNHLQLQGVNGLQLQGVNGAYIMGGVFYVEPNYLHLTGFEMVPRIGIGACQLHIPGLVYSGPDDRKADYQATAGDELAWREDIGVNIIADLLFKFRITPRFHINASVGLDYFPALGQTKIDIGDPDLQPFYDADKSLSLYNLGLSCSYTFNPSEYNPERLPLRKNWIDLSYVSAFRTIPSYSPHWKDGYYYVGGMHYQWTVQTSKHHALAFGTEWVKDWAVKEQLKSLVVKNDIKASFIMGHEFLWGRIVLGQYLGWYAMNMTPHKEFDGSFLNDQLYTQFGGIFKITKWLHIGSSIRYAVYITDQKAQYVSDEAKPPFFLFEKEYVDFKIGYTF